MVAVLPDPGGFEITSNIVIIGAGACGLVAGMAAREAAFDGATILLLERDKSPSGSTALSSGFIPAAGTKLQNEKGIEDSPERLEADIMAKAKGSAHFPLVRAVTAEIREAIDWLSSVHGLPFILIDGFLYPGHATYRMHAMPQKTGAALQAALLDAAEQCDLPIAGGHRAEILYRDGQ